MTDYDYDYDYVIVGSGVAAATVAKTLLEHDRSTSILLLEAGPEVPARDRRSWWDYVVNDVQPYSYCYDQPGETASLGNTKWEFDGSRVMAYGGSTMHWGGWCLRYKPEDFWLRTNTGAGGDWPFTYDDLEPYYCRAEHHLSVCGDDTEGWTKRSEPYPRPPFPWTAADGEMIEAMTQLGIKPGKMPVARVPQVHDHRHVQVLPVRRPVLESVRQRRAARRSSAHELRDQDRIARDADPAQREARRSGASSISTPSRGNRRLRSGGAMS